MDRSEFAEFLIARRGQLRPEAVGLPSGRRRRTPGLRREEVAALAGVSVDYLARLEQGRDTNPSSSVLTALADALRLNEVERHHLGRLALGLDHQVSTCPSDGQSFERVSETVQAVLDAMHPTPAFLFGRHLNVLAWNAAWRDFAEPIGLLDERAHDNFAYYLFGHPAAEKYWIDWPAIADLVTSMLRTARSHWADDERLGATIESLQLFPEFSRRWREHRMTDFRSATVHLDHPVRGEVEVEIETFNPAMDQSVMVWLVDRRQVHVPGLRLVNE